MEINERAASNALKLLVGEQGCQAFTAIYQALDTAEQAGEARGRAEGFVAGQQEGFALGRTEGNEEEFCDGWRAGYAASEREQDDYLADAAAETAAEAYLLDDDFDEDEDDVSWRATNYR